MKLAVPSSIDPEIGEAVEVPAWLKRLRGEMSHRTFVWFVVSICMAMAALPFYAGLYLKLLPLGYAYHLVSLMYLVMIFYIFLIFYTIGCEPVPYVLRRSEKLWIESVVVVASSCWTFFVRDSDICTAILGPLILFKLVPLLNLWWDFTNFNFWDCCFALLIDAALVYCRSFGGLALMAVTGFGVALHFIKDAYRQNSTLKFKNGTQKHLV